VAACGKPETSEDGPPFLAGACDCHAHLFGPQHRYPFVPERRYTPADATLADYRAEMARLGITRAVLTAPSVHGTDNGALFEGLKSGGEDFRGITMVAADVADAELERQHGLGVRGIRTQLKPHSAKPLTLAELRVMAERVRHLGWHVEVHVDVAVMPDVAGLLRSFPTDVVIEHMGHMPAGLGVGHPGFQSLLRLLGCNHAWVKLSGAYINSAAPPPHHDMRPFVDALVQAAPDRTVWGSNWPHPHQNPVPDATEWLAATSRWLGADRVRRILSENPGRLYDFDIPKGESR
jgi:predicted TIM-barrel fold metal-dependent hydrolase